MAEPATTVQRRRCGALALVARLLVVVLGMAGHAAQAQATGPVARVPIPTFGDSPCVERVAPAASGAAAPAPTRLPELRYECHVVRG
ncbi:MAG: hypothetical protein RL375_3013, partial [Pseudomonadota bacterium]